MNVSRLNWTSDIVRNGRNGETMIIIPASIAIGLILIRLDLRKYGLV